MKFSVFKHPYKNNETYWSHFKFAITVGVTLGISSVAFVLHAIIPLGMIPKKLNLTELSKKIYIWCEHIEHRKYMR